MSEEEKEFENRRRAATKQEKKDRQDAASKAAVEKIDGGSGIINQTVLEYLNFKDPCNLAEEYAMFKAMSGRRTFVYYDEKMAYARWLETPAHLRNPQTLEEAAPILGVSHNTLIAWKNAPEVTDFINADMEKRMLGLYPLAMYKWGVNIDRGDIRSIEAYKNYYEEKNKDRASKRKGLDLPQEIIKEANDYARSQGEQNRGVALDAEKSMVKENYFNKPIDLEEIKQ